MVRTKVFVGNLSFATKETELAKHFEVAGKVISTNIITRGPRSLGYGFVEMENEADAENAVKLLDKKDIDGRPINVEVAKVREENANPTNNQGQDQSQNQGNQGQSRGGNRGGRGGRRPRGRRPQGGNQGSGQPQNNQGQQGIQNQGNQGQQNQGNQGQRNQGNSNRGGSSNRGPSSGAPRPPRPARQPRPEGEDTRTPSTTTLFVANLPYALEDDAFAKVLKDGTLAYKTAKVSVKKKSGRSKGFGFIEFETEADQQKALAALQGKKINDRDIVVKVALTGQRESGDANVVANKTTSAPVTDVVAPTNKPSEIKANVAATKQAEKPVTPKQEKK